MNKKKKFHIKKRASKKKYFLLLFLLFTLILIILLMYFLIFKKKGNQNNNTIYNKKEIQIKRDKHLINEVKEGIDPPWFKEKLIIHSLGEYNNFTYVDSLEPLNFWYFEKKMNLMEADFMLTKDNHTILAHDYKDFNYKDLNYKDLDYIPTLEEFKKLPGKGNTTRMTFEDLVLFMEKNKDLYIITDTKYSDLTRIEIEFDEMTSILANHKELYERFIIEIYNEKMYFFLKNKYLFKYFIFTLYKRWEPPWGLRDLQNIFAFCKTNEICGILFFQSLLNEHFLNFSRNYSVPLYLHTVNDIGKAVYFMNKGVKGIMTDNITYELLEKYLIDNNLKLNQTNNY